jgi:hypothetical protein
MNREELVSRMLESINYHDELTAAVTCADIAEQYHTSLTPKPTDSAKEVLRVVSCNGMREMTEERILEAMEQYAKDANEHIFFTSF